MIKSTIVFFSLFFLTCNSLIAQKIYATKTAQIKFESSTSTEDLEATNNQVDSKLIDNGQVEFKLLMKGFVFDNEMMQDHFNGKEYMESDKFPKAEFKGTIANIATVNFAKDGAYPVMVSGNLTIKGITVKESAAGLIIIEKGKVNTKSNFKIKLKDFGIVGKDIGSVISNMITITVSAKYE